MGAADVDDRAVRLLRPERRDVNREREVVRPGRGDGNFRSLRACSSRSDPEPRPRFIVALGVKVLDRLGLLLDRVACSSVSAGMSNGRWLNEHARADA